MQLCQKHLNRVDGKDEKVEPSNVEEVQQPKWRRRLVAAGLVGTLLLAAVLCKRLGRSRGLVQVWALRAMPHA
eukprot:symbB.v1.2.025881.t1/scaffold2545.1/size76554/4